MLFLHSLMGDQRGLPRVTATVVLKGSPVTPIISGPSSFFLASVYADGTWSPLGVFPSAFKAGFGKGEPNTNLEEKERKRRCGDEPENQNPGPQFPVFSLTSHLQLESFQNRKWL